MFYDFGQAAELTQGQADGILEIIEAIVDMDVEKSMDAFAKMGVLKPTADLDKVRRKGMVSWLSPVSPFASTKT